MKRSYVSDGGDGVVTKSARKNSGKVSRKYAKGQAQMDKKVVATVQRVLAKQIEKKFADNNFIFTLGTTTMPIRLTALSQGVTDSDRIGDKVNLDYYSARITLVGDNGTSAPFYQRVRTIIFQWFPDDGASAPTAATIINGGTSHIFGYYNTNQTSNFKVLYDKKQVMSNEPANPSFENVQEINIRKSEVKPIKFAGTVTNASNHLYLLIMTNNGSVDPVTGVFNGRMRYADA